MESNRNSFPVFVSGQYLTSEHLNEMQGFLWQEEKDTRSFVCGNGIIAGMVPSFEDGTILKKINLSAGAASTVDGYLVITDPVFIAENINKSADLDEYAVKTTDIAFDKYVGTNLQSIVKDGARQLREAVNLESVDDKTDLGFSVYELFSEDSKLEELPAGANTLESLNISAAQASANYFLIAWVFVKDAENDHCQQGDCNTKGIQRNFITRYFLIDSATFAEMNKGNDGNSSFATLDTCSTARIAVLSQQGSTIAIQTSAQKAWGISVNSIDPYFDGGTLKPIATIVDAEEEFSNAVENFAEIKNSITKNIYTQYYVLFAGDLAKAINELVLFYNDYVEKNPNISRDRIERVVVIGNLQITGIDKWRYYFIPMPGQTQHIADKRKLRKLFLRVTSLIGNFIPSSEKLGKIAPKVKAIPTLTGEAPIQDRAIPFYYDLNNGDVRKYWNPQGGNLKNILCYYDQGIDDKLSYTDWYNINFFRIEGHVGMDIAAAKAAISALIAKDDLPIQLLDCNVNYKGPQKWNKWWVDFSGLINTSVKNLRKDENLKYTYDPLKKISVAAMETSYRKPEEVKTILNDLTAYSGVFYNAKFENVAAPKKAKKGLTASGSEVTMKNPITKDVAEKYKKEISPDTLNLYIKNFNDAVTELKDPQTKNLIILKDLLGLEYMGGALRGGTFVLLHDGTKVIGDGCLPFFYRLNQARIFN